MTTDQSNNCNQCLHQQVGANAEIICRLTGREAEWEGECASFKFNAETPDVSIFEEMDNQVSAESAGRWKRFANFIIDWIFMYLIIIVLTFSLGLILAITYPDAVTEEQLTGPYWNYLFPFVFFVLFYTLIEYFTRGRSIGKFITKTKVITLTGEKPNFKTFLTRSFCRCIPFEQFSFLGSIDAGWHDSISQTRVVNIR